MVGIVLLVFNPLSSEPLAPSSADLSPLPDATNPRLRHPPHHAHSAHRKLHQTHESARGDLQLVP